MPSVDCWSLLGLPRGASVDEIRNAYAQRVRDVHPDAGGTGDGLTMSLLKDARDEALGLAGQPATALARPPKARAPMAPKVSGRPCNVCGQRMPRDHLDFYRIHAGFNGRPKSAKVLVCAPCTHVVAADRKRREFEKLVVGLCMMAAFILIAIVYAAIVETR